MKTQIEFRSFKFPPCEGEEEINPGLWGKRLTEYLALKLAEFGIETDEMAILPQEYLSRTSMVNTI